MKLPRHPLVLAVKPIIEALGAQLVPLESREPGDLPLKWEGSEVDNRRELRCEAKSIGVIRPDAAHE